MGIRAVSALSPQSSQGLLRRPSDERSISPDQDAAASVGPNWLQVGAGRKGKVESSMLESEEEQERAGGSRKASQGPEEASASNEDEAKTDSDTNGSAEEQASGSKHAPGKIKSTRDASQSLSEEAEQSQGGEREDQDADMGSQRDADMGSQRDTERDSQRDADMGSQRDADVGSQMDEPEATPIGVGRQEKPADKDPVDTDKTKSPQSSRNAASGMVDFSTDDQPHANRRSDAEDEQPRQEARSTAVEEARPSQQKKEERGLSSRTPRAEGEDWQEGSMETSEQDGVRATNSDTLDEPGAGTKAGRDSRGPEGDDSEEASELGSGEESLGNKPSGSSARAPEFGEEPDDEENRQPGWTGKTEKPFSRGTTGKKRRARSRKKKARVNNKIYASSEESLPRQPGHRPAAAAPATSPPEQKSESGTTPPSTPNTNYEPHLGYGTARNVCVSAGCKRVSSSSDDGTNGLTGESRLLGYTVKSSVLALRGTSVLFIASAALPSA